VPVTKTVLPSGRVKVSTPHGVKAKSTSKANADKLERLLNAVDHGWKPTGKRTPKPKRQ
jgi:hypothetical protein